MDIAHTTMPGGRVLHHCTTLTGQRFGVMEEPTGRRLLLVYGLDDPDTPQQTIVMEQDEADQVAEILHSRPVLDRLAALERRLAEFTGTVR